LRQVAEDAACAVLVPEHVDVSQRDPARVRLLKRNQGPHEGGLASAVWSEKAEHARADREGDVAQRLNAALVALREVVDA